MKIESSYGFGHTCILGTKTSVEKMGRRMKQVDEDKMWSQYDYIRGTRNVSEKVKLP